MSEYKSDFDGKPLVYRPFCIEPLPHERQRLPKMTEEDRMRRKQWKMDQILSKKEPMVEAAFSPRYSYQRNVPYRHRFRQIYRYPMDTFAAKVLQPMLGRQWAGAFRWAIPRCFAVVLGIQLMVYQIKYNPRTWENHHGLRLMVSQARPGPEGKPERKADEYFSLGFNERTAFRH
ncbi:hypothetical protein SNEBB_003560 [Seison nebaliae]|nr:hypothetical protein SNEBB_003560 [Seison nebaliae]